MAKPMTSWQKLVKDTYAAGRKKNSNYKFSDALKDAKKKYRKK